MKHEKAINTITAALTAASSQGILPAETSERFLNPTETKSLIKHVDNHSPLDPILVLAHEKASIESCLGILLGFLGDSPIYKALEQERNRRTDTLSKISNECVIMQLKVSR